MNSDKKIELSSETTIADYETMLREEDRTKIANFIFQRLFERYVLPLQNVPSKYKNGFSIMANACLLIETYESFRQGWDDTNDKNRIPFKSFFDREIIFHDFKDYSKDFYVNVRCGILHQGETKQGWKITRKSDCPLFMKTEKRINASKFLNALKEVLEEYAKSLSISSWNDEIWLKCRQKMDFIVNNCKE